MMNVASLRGPLLVATSILLLLILSACGDDDREETSSPFPQSNLSESEISSLHDVAHRLEDEGILRPAVPLYIPNGIERLPFQADGSPGGATLVFGRGLIAEDGRPVAINVILSQGFSGTDIVYEPPFIDLDGALASEQSPEPGDEMALYALTFTIENRDFLVSVTWDAPNNELTADMKNETIILARSIIADLHQQQLPTVSSVVGG